MQGYLANLDPDHYKSFFREHLPLGMTGQLFLDRYGLANTCFAAVESSTVYEIRRATDHHVLEARRVRRFVEFLGQADQTTGRKRKLALDKAGHLMYASHFSYTNDALLGADECDLLVQLIRQRESSGFYGARISGRGCGGTVVVMAETCVLADDSLAEIIELYERQTGRKPRLLAGSTPGAWQVGTQLI